MKDRKESGFTLIELLVVVVILGILLAIAIPSVIKAYGWKNTLYLPRTYHEKVENIVIRPVNFNGFKQVKESIFSKNSRIAILVFKDPEKTQAGALISDMFTAFLEQEGYQVLERDNIDRVLSEQQIIEGGSTNLTDLEIAKRLGKLVSADYMIFGAVTLYQVSSQVVALPIRIKDEDREDYEKDYSTYKKRYINGPHLNFWVSKEDRGKQFRRKLQISSLEELEDKYNSRLKTEFHVIASIGVSAKVVDVKSGKILWLGQGETNDFDVVSATRRILVEFLNSIQENKVKQTSEIFSKENYKNNSQIEKTDSAISNP